MFLPCVRPGSDESLSALSISISSVELVEIINEERKLPAGADSHHVRPGIRKAWLPGAGPDLNQASYCG